MLPDNDLFFVTSQCIGERANNRDIVSKADISILHQSRSEIYWNKFFLVVQEISIPDLTEGQEKQKVLAALYSPQIVNSITKKPVPLCSFKVKKYAKFGNGGFLSFKRYFETKSADSLQFYLDSYFENTGEPATFLARKKIQISFTLSLK